MGEPKLDTVEGEGWTPPADVTHPVGKTASRANEALAESILRKVAATSDKVDILKESGRRFNASRAQLDLHRIANQVQQVLAEGDLSDPTATQTLAEVAEQTDEIHNLFDSIDL